MVKVIVFCTHSRPIKKFFLNLLWGKINEKLFSCAVDLNSKKLHMNRICYFFIRSGD